MVCEPDGGIVDRGPRGGAVSVHQPAFEHAALAGRERRHHERARRRFGRVTHREPLHERAGVAVGAEQVANRGGVGQCVGGSEGSASQPRCMCLRAAVAGAGGTAVEHERLHLPRESGDEVGRQVGRGGMGRQCGEQGRGDHGRRGQRPDTTDAGACGGHGRGG
jgi:hypothetical protein